MEEDIRKIPIGSTFSLGQMMLHIEECKKLDREEKKIIRKKKRRKKL